MAMMKRGIMKIHLTRYKIGAGELKITLGKKKSEDMRKFTIMKINEIIF